MTRSHHKLIYAATGILILGLVLLLSILGPSRMRPETTVVAVLISARESRPMMYPDEGVFASDDLMIVEQSEERSPITEPISEQISEQLDPTLIEHDCGTLTLTITRDRNISLNTDEMGSLDQTTELTKRLMELFEQRIVQRAYLSGMEKRTDLPDIQRIPRTIIIRPSASIAYGDVLMLIELLKQLQAEPIGLQIGHLPA